MPKKSIWGVFKQTFSEFSEDNVLRLSAALAYYAIFSIGPLLAIVVGVAGLVLGAESVRHQVGHQLEGMLGQGGAKTVESMMSSQRKGTSVITTIVGVIALLFGAGGVFGQLQDSLNTIWEVKPKPGIGVWGMIRTRFLSFSMVLGVGFLLLISMALSTALTAMTEAIQTSIPMGGFLAHGLDIVVSFGVVMVLFAMIFKVLPDVKVPWKKVWMGAAMTTLLFTIGKELLALYLGRASTTSTYGAAGSVIIILMWVYYASVILFFGAEFTQVYAKNTGTVVRPTEYAVPVTAEERAQQGLAAPEPSPAGATHSSATGTKVNAPREGGSSTVWPEQARPGVTQGRGVGVLSVMLATGFIAGTVFRMTGIRAVGKILAHARKTAEKAEGRAGT